MSETPPAALRGAVLSGLAPVKVLSRPWRRALALLPLGLLLLVGQPLVLGLRADAASLGPLLLWGLSGGQTALGMLLTAVALREAVPGRGLARGAFLALGAGALASLAVTFWTYSASATRVPAGRFGFFWVVCFGGPLVLGLPALAAALALALRAYPLRAGVVGALAGLGAGLMSDAGWRTFCHVSDPAHVLSAHLPAALVLGALGAAMAAWRNPARA